MAMILSGSHRERNISRIPGMMTEKAVTSVAVPDVDGIAQKCAFVRRVGKLKGIHRSSKVTSGYS